MLLTTENKRALKRLKGEKNLTYKSLAHLIGVHDNTIRRIIKSDEAEEIKTVTYTKIMQFISKNY